MDDKEPSSMPTPSSSQPASEPTSNDATSKASQVTPADFETRPETIKHPLTFNESKSPESDGFIIQERLENE